MNRSLAPALYSRLLESLSSSCSFRNDDLVFSFVYFTSGRSKRLIFIVSINPPKIQILYRMWNIEFVQSGTNFAQFIRIKKNKEVAKIWGL